MSEKISALKPLVGIKKFQYGVWDIEAVDWWNLQVIGCFDGSNYYWFRTVDEFLNHILQRKYRNWRWFAHFGGRYDMNFIFDRIRHTSSYSVKFYCSGSMVINMTIIKKDNTSTHLCDSYRLLPAKLVDLGIAFDVKHKKQRFDFFNMQFNKQLLEYNEYDCRCLYEVLYSFFEQTGIRSETFATHAMRVFRKDFLSITIYKPKGSVSNFIREGYCGGRVEVFKRGNDNISCYDVNSMYPYVMQFPVPIVYLGQSRHLKDHTYGFIRALVSFPDTYIPCLPVRREKLYFPCGQFEGVWSTSELKEACNRGLKILKIYDAHYFKCDSIFLEYVRKLYALKKTAAEPTRTIAKYLLNSLYGKFGQTPDKKVYITEDIAPEKAMPVLTPIGKPTGFMTYTRTSNSGYLLPNIAAAITSNARLHLLNRMTNSTYYCDTDSIFTDSEMETGSELGQWSLVARGTAIFYQSKLYKFNGKWKAKGLNLEQDIDQFIQGQPNTSIRKASIKEALSTNTAACRDINVVKEKGDSRPKRAWINDFDTRPWNVKELDN